MGLQHGGDIHSWGVPSGCASRLFMDCLWIVYGSAVDILMFMMVFW